MFFDTASVSWLLQLQITWKNYFTYLSRICFVYVYFDPLNSFICFVYALLSASGQLHINEVFCSDFSTTSYENVDYLNFVLLPAALIEV